MKNQNVIYVDFVSKSRIEMPNEADQIETLEIETVQVEAPKQKKRKVKGMTKRELHVISCRIDEINEALDLCDFDHDTDVMENLERELGQLEAKLSQAV